MKMIKEKKKNLSDIYQVPTFRYVKIVLKIVDVRGIWEALSLKRPTLAQVMISQFVGSSPASGSVLTAQGAGACFGFCVSLSLCPSPAHALSLSQK